MIIAGNVGDPDWQVIASVDRDNRAANSALLLAAPDLWSDNEMHGPY
jgi:hypothetical protein